MKNTRGSALVWAVVSSLILLILILGILTIGQANFIRTVNEASKSQAYLTARSTVETIIKDLQSGNSDIQKILDDYEELGLTVDELELLDFVIYLNGAPVSDTGGEVLSAKMKRTDEKKWQIEVKAQYNDFVETVTANIINEVTTITEEVFDPNRRLFKMDEVFHGIFANNVAMPNNSILNIDYELHPESDAYLMNINTNTNRQINMLHRGVLNSGHTLTGTTLTGMPSTTVTLNDGALFNSIINPDPNVFAPNVGFDGSLSTGGFVQTNSFNNLASGTSWDNPRYHYVYHPSNSQSFDITRVSYAYVFIFLMDNNSSITISGNNPNVRVYVHGTLQNSVTLANGTNLWGSIVANQLIVANNGTATIHYVEPPKSAIGEAYFGQPRNVSLGWITTRTVDWGFVGYE